MNRRETFPRRGLNYGILLLAFVLPLVFYSLTKDNFLIKKTILSTIILLLISLEITRLMGKGKIELYRGKLFFPIIFFTLAMALSLFNSRNLAVSLEAFFEKVIFIAVYFLVVNGVVTGERIGKVIKVILFSSLLVGIYGLFQYFGLDFVRWGTTFGGRITSSFGNPNFLSGYLVAVIPLSLSFSLLTKKTITKKLSFLAVTILLLICLILTGTRGSWIAFAGSIFVWLLLVFLFGREKASRSEPKRKIGRGMWMGRIFGITILLLIVGYITLADTPITRRVKSIFNPDISSVQERIFKWRTAQEMIKDHPLFGVGIGAVKVNYALYQAKAKEKMEIPLRATSESQIHNEYLQIWAEAGIVGLLAFLSIILAFFYAGIKQLRKRKDIISGGILIGILASVAGILMDSIPNFPLHIVPTGFLFWLYLGVAERIGEEQEPGPEKPIPPGGYVSPRRVTFGRRLGQILVILVFLFFWFKFGVLEFIADSHRRNGDIAIAEKNWGKAIAEYKLAHRLNPTHGRICYDLGMAYVERKEYERAIWAFLESINIRHYGEVYNDLGNCYYLKGRKDEAIENWEMAVKLGLPNPKDQEIVERNLQLLKRRK